jgi:hypothetical protein
MDSKALKDHNNAIKNDKLGFIRKFWPNRFYKIGSRATARGPFSTQISVRKSEAGSLKQNSVQNWQSLT